MRVSAPPREQIAGFALVFPDLASGKKRFKPMAWSDKFSHPIRWGARSIHTLQDARVFILSLSRLHGGSAWLDANELLRQAAEHGGLWRDLARIQIMNALLGSKPKSKA